MDGEMSQLRTDVTWMGELMTDVTWMGELMTDVNEPPLESLTDSEHSLKH